jgi:hypothetical protein
MDVNVPKKVFYSSNVPYWTRHDDKQYCLWIRADDEDVTLDDTVFFAQRKVDGRGANVCHAKLIARDDQGRDYVPFQGIVGNWSAPHYITGYWSAPYSSGYAYIRDTGETAQHVFFGSDRIYAHYLGPSAKTNCVIRETLELRQGKSGGKYYRNIYYGGTYRDEILAFWQDIPKDLSPLQFIEPFMNYMEQVMLQGPYLHPTKGSKYTVTLVDWIETEHDDSVFLMNEPSAIMYGNSDYLDGKGSVAYWRNVGIQHAYLDCLQNVPRFNENTIANIAEVVTFIKRLVVDKRIDIPDSLGSAWLSYRYAYGTTKMDAKEAISFVHRRMDLKGLDSIRSYGMHWLSYKDTDVCFRCSADFEEKNLKTLKKVWSALYRYGLQPNFYVVWDLIPYSFIVDWFLPIGDALSAADAQNHYAQTYDISYVNSSITYNVQTKYGTVRCYTRWRLPNSPEVRSIYFLERGSTSSKTRAFRFLDALSLVIGRR